MLYIDMNRLIILVGLLSLLSLTTTTTYAAEEDDGYIIGDDDSQGEVSSQDELEDTYDDTDYDVDDGDFDEAQERDQDAQEQQNEEEQITCPDGTTISTGDYCPDVIICNDGTTIAADQQCPSIPTAQIPTQLVPVAPEPEQSFTCSDGTIVTGDATCPSTGPNPYCDKVKSGESKSTGTCHDRYDTSETTGLASCNDGTQKQDPKDCKDATELPRCEYKVIVDCVLNDLGQTCETGTSEDACQDIYNGYDGTEYKPGDKIIDPTPTPAPTPAPTPIYTACPDGINDGIYTSYVLVGQTCPANKNMQPVDCYLISKDPYIEKIQDSLCA